MDYELNEVEVKIIAHDIADYDEKGVALVTTVFKSNGERVPGIPDVTLRRRDTFTIRKLYGLLLIEYK